MASHYLAVFFFFFFNIEKQNNAQKIFPVEDYLCDDTGAVGALLDRKFEIYNAISVQFTLSTS